jgi:hypothetical protein
LFAFSNSFCKKVIQLLVPTTEMHVLRIVLVNVKFV